MSNPLHDALRHHVTGAIERGESEPIVEVPANYVRAERARRALDYYQQFAGDPDDFVASAKDLIVDLCHMFHEQTGDYADQVLASALRHFHAEQHEEKVVGVAREYLEAHDGDWIAATTSFAYNLMRGDPATLKAGYSAENAAIATAEAFGFPSVWRAIRARITDSQEAEKTQRGDSL